MTADLPADLVLPVGLPLGSRSDVPGVGGVVRLGWEPRALDPDQARVWGLAHGLADDDPVGGRDLLVQRAGEVGVREPDTVVADLLAAGLLAVPGPENAQRLRARPLLIGLGPGTARGSYALGLPGRPVLELPGTTVLRWQDTTRCRDLWSAALLAAARASADPEQLPDDEAGLARLPEVLGDLPVLISHLCGYLDLA